jgi:hypothetical protein
MQNVVTVIAPSAHPAHFDFLKLLTGIQSILTTSAPTIINLAPSPQLGVAIVGAELGLGIAEQIAQLLAQMHPAAPTATPAK